jgi:cytochrome o ubiquinol oxidase subunit 2
MYFAVVATSPQQFQQWLVATRARGGTLDKVGFADLSRPTHAAEPLSFAHVDPELFNIVATGKVATQWSPEEAR